MQQIEERTGSVVDEDVSRIIEWRTTTQTIPINPKRDFINGIIAQISITQLPADKVRCARATGRNKQGRKENKGKF